MENERIILRTRNRENISMLMDRMGNGGTINILGINYKVISVGVGVTTNDKTEKWDTRIFKLEGIVK